MALTFTEKLDTPEFRALFERWEKYRRKNGGKSADWQKLFQGHLNTLAAQPVGHAAQIIEKSMLNGWVGLFPLGERETSVSPVFPTPAPASDPEAHVRVMAFAAQHGRRHRDRAELNAWWQQREQTNPEAK